jgi:hypothetical protein
MKEEKSLKKAIVFDAGSLISLSINGLLDELKKLKEIFNGAFLITEEIKSEIIDKPLKIKAFKLEALKIRQLLDENILERAEKYGIPDSIIKDKADEILDVANGIFVDSKNRINIMHLGEASCLALSKILSEKGIENVIAIDERTTRMLVEKPENLKDLLERKLHIKINVAKGNFQYFKNFRTIRSVELMYVAWKKNLVNLRNGEVLDALLYALKFKGCAVSDEEIDEIKKLK